MEQSHRSTQGEVSAEDGGSADINTLATEFSDVARLLQAEDDTEAMLDELVASAVRLVPGAQEGSISVVTGRTDVTAQHPSGKLPQQVDALQSETGQGPCLDAVYEQQTVRVADMRTEQRWPQFARRAYQAGAGAMLSFQLFVEGDNLGALNLYSREAGAFDDESEQVGLLFASHAAVAFADARKLDHLGEAMSTRDLIGQAKGILMERYSIDGGAAFRVLVRVSQQSHDKLRDVAAELVTTRRLDALRGPDQPAPTDPDA